MSWSDHFRHPVPLPDGTSLATLSDARDYILKLPESEWDAAPWQDIYEDIKRAAHEFGPWMDFARLGLMRAIYRPGVRLAKK